MSHAAEVESTLHLFRVRAKTSAGFTAEQLELHRSNLVIHQAESQFAAATIRDAVIVADGSLLQISDSSAETQYGGLAITSLRVDGGSTVRIDRVNARSGAAGFTALGDVVVSANSIISISNVSTVNALGEPAAAAAGFLAGGLKVIQNSMVSVEHAQDKGGFYAGPVTVADGPVVRVHDAASLGSSGGGFFADSIRRQQPIQNQHFSCDCCHGRRWVLL